MAPDESLEAWLDRHTFRRRIPLRGVFELTHQCNLHCCHCYVDAIERSVSTEDAKRIIDEIRGSGCLELSLSGGELFTRSDALDLIAYARSKYLAVNILSNGTLIDYEIAKSLRDLFIQKVQVSIYDPEPHVHDGITGVDGSFDATRGALELLAEMGVPTIISSPVLSETSQDFEGLMVLAEAMGAGLLVDPFITPARSGSIAPKAHQVDSQKAAIAMVVAKQLSKKYRASSNEETGCGAGRNIFYVSPGGNLSPCIDWLIILGNLLEESFPKIWYESEEVGRMMDYLNPDNIQVCRSCQLKEFCSRCPGRAYHDDEDPLGCATHSKFKALINSNVEGGGIK